MLKTGFTVRLARSRVAAAAFVVVGAMALASCGAAATPAPASTTPSSAPAVASDAPASGSGAGSGTGDCGGATAALVMKTLARPDVVSVTTEGGCHDATIVTSLGASDSSTALAICDAAAVVAYAGDLSSVTVLAAPAANNKELSIGIKGQPCIAEP